MLILQNLLKLIHKFRDMVVGKGMWSSFSEQLRRAFWEAAQTARRDAHPEVLPEHLALSILRVRPSAAKIILERLRVPIAEVEKELEIYLRHLPRRSFSGAPKLSVPVKQMIDESWKIARRHRCDWIGTHHLLLSLGHINCYVSNVLREYGLSFADYEREMQRGDVVDGGA
ncbi:MAG: hypothetical protein KatS3mg016_0059 [Fimbriimonadales bacterium]|nr:MAG: hypothetical protein KatS3mg016_0059 [Fimbriimonadales bacterium]